MDNYSKINTILVRLFNDILDYESKVFKNTEFKDITTNDMHIIDVIGLNQKKNMSGVAKDLSVTMGTLTISINNLVKKGYVTRVRSEKDRRIVYVELSKKGIDAYNKHNEFHKDMVTSMLDTLDDKETEILIKGLHKIDTWIHFVFKISFSSTSFIITTLPSTGAITHS